MKIKNIEITWSGIVSSENGFFYWWNWLPKEYRYIGFKQMYYDGPWPSFGFWFFNWSWRTHYSKVWKHLRKFHIGYNNDGKAKF